MTPRLHRFIAPLLLGVIFGASVAQAQTPNPAPDRFAQLDKDADGKLSTSEVAAMPSLARLVPVADLDKDGSVTEAELKALRKIKP